MKRKVISAVCAAAVLCGAAALPFSAIRFAGLALIAIAMCTAFFVLVRRKGLRRAGIVVVSAGLALFLSAEIPVLAGAHADDDTSAEYLIAAGCGVKGTEPTNAMRERMTAALAWLEAHPDGIVIVSGSRCNDGEDISEAQAMENYLLEHGIAPARVIKEEQAGSTAENIRYSLEIIRQRGGDASGTVAFVSSEYHLYRIRTMARRAGCSPVCAAAHTKDPISLVSYCVREALAVWKMRILALL